MLTTRRCCRRFQWSDMLTTRRCCRRFQWSANHQTLLSQKPVKCYPPDPVVADSSEVLSTRRCCRRFQWSAIHQTLLSQIPVKCYPRHAVVADSSEVLTTTRCCQSNFGSAVRLLEPTDHWRNYSRLTRNIISPATAKLPSFKRVCFCVDVLKISFILFYFLIISKRLHEYIEHSRTCF